MLRIITRLNIGGPARQALLLTRSLSDRFPTTLLAGTPPLVEGELTDPFVSVTRVPLVREISPRADGSAFLAIHQLIRKQQPAIIHTHMAKAGAIGRAATLTMRRRPVTIHTFHGHVLEGYFSPTTQRVFLAAERALAARTDALIAVSEEIRDQLLDMDIGRREQWHVVPLGLELDRHLAVAEPRGKLRAQIGVSAGAPLIGFIGRLAPIKDVPTLLRALRNVPDAHLAVIGDGGLRRALEAEADALGLADRVHFTGWWGDMPEAISDLDVVALTSLNEGTPVALIEALACGIPVVATRVGGIPAVVKAGETGYLVPPGDADALAEVLSDLLSDPSARRRLGETGRGHVLKSYAAHRLVRDIRALYTELLAR